MDDEQVLTGGNATDGDVLRIGATVRKPWTESTPSVVEFMAAIRDAGVDVPEVFGRDEQGRQITEFVPGRLALDAGPLTHAELHRVGAMVRMIHDDRPPQHKTSRPPAGQWPDQETSVEQYRQKGRTPPRAHTPKPQPAPPNAPNRTRVGGSRLSAIPFS